MTRTVTCFLCAVLAMAGGCRSGEGFKFLGVPARAAAPAAAAPAPASPASPVPLAADLGTPAAAESVATVDPQRASLMRTADDRQPSREPSFDPKLYQTRPPGSPIRVRTTPTCDPAERPIDPRLYADRAVSRSLESEEDAILRAQGQSRQGTVRLDFGYGPQPPSAEIWAGDRAMR